MRITIANNTVDGVKGGIFNLNGKDVHAMQARIDQLERELDQLTLEWEEEMELRMSMAQDLRAEKALADQLYNNLMCGDAYTRKQVLVAYRKARGL